MTTQPVPVRNLLRPALLGVLALITCVATACSSSGGTSSTTGSTTRSAANSHSISSAGDPVAAARADLAKYAGKVTSFPTISPVSGVSALKGKNIWYIPLGSAVPVLNAFGVGMQGALAQLGISYHTCDGKFLPTTVAACMNQAVAQGADGVVTGYIDYKLVPNAFQNLVSHHIPVLAAGEANDTGKADSPGLAFDDTTPTVEVLQRLNDESVIADSGGKAKILFVGVTDSPQTLEGAAIAKKFFADNCPGCTFNEIDYNTESLNKVPSQVSAALISHPDTTYVVVELDAGAASAVSGIQTAGFANKVKLAATNGGLDSLQRIKAGTVQFEDVGLSSTYLGWQFTDGVVRMMMGRLPVANLGIVRVFTKDNVGGLALTPAAYTTNAWYGSDEFETNFLTAWGVA
jgi:ABC-type sugar transport system substrate-binding protein